MWEYDYGHDLDPTAAIVVPGMSYQPPLFGSKQLLNFTAHSYPDTGGWVVIGAGLLTVLLLVYETKFNKTSAAKVKINETKLTSQDNRVLNNTLAQELKNEPSLA